MGFCWSVLSPQSNTDFFCSRCFIIQKWCITKDDYDKKLQELKDKQYKLNLEPEEHTKADHKYYIQVSTILNLTKRLKDIFESSELKEKRAILNYLLQNPTVSSKKLDFTLRKPYNLLLELSGCPNWLRR